jgi:hypothetical protein
VALEQVGELDKRLGQAPSQQPQLTEDGAARHEDVPARGRGRIEGEMVEAAHRLGGDVRRI